jgi:hypothetical protein
LALVVSPSLTACSFSSKNDETSPGPELTIQALQFQLTLQAQNAQITALAQTVAAPQQPQAPGQPVPPVQPVETSAPPPQPPTNSKPAIKVKTDAPCLQFPSDGYPVLDVIPAGQTAEIPYNKMEDMNTKSKVWWPVWSPKKCICWVSEENIESITGDVSGLKVFILLAGQCPK